MKKKLNKSWKVEVLKAYWDKPEKIGRKVAKQYGVPWATMFDFKQRIIQGVIKYEDTVTKPKILLFDVETAPILSHVWSLWDQRVGLNQVMCDWYMLSWSAKWLGEEEVYHDRLYNHLSFEENPEDDYNIIVSLWEMLDQADIIIGHNLKKFDDKKFKARCLYHGLTEPSSYRRVDTLDIAKRAFKLTSNKLDYLATYLKVPNKVSHEGHGLWVKCMAGEQTAWDVMTEYNNYDVVLLEDVYLQIRHWSNNHPNVAVFYDDDYERCTLCGSVELENTGHLVFTNLASYEEVRCKCCSKLSRRSSNLLSKDKRSNLLRNYNR